MTDCAKDCPACLMGKIGLDKAKELDRVVQEKILGAKDD